ncbi:MAG: DEAD/DEAH box helicase [Lachnospiraceae bacterium]|nr:DEAD/DEAH box helicase [Lachnospiraceae bacterium]
MAYIESIVKAIEDVFKLSEDNVSSLTIMLSNIEANRLYDKFAAVDLIKEYSKNDLISKINLLDALLEILLENPNMENIPSGKRKELIVGICGTVASLYEQILLQIEDDALWEGMSYLVMYSMLSYMADCQTMSDLLIQEYNAKLLNAMNLYNKSSCLQRLEYDTFYLIVYLMSNIRNYEGLLQINNLIDKANQNLVKVQEEELEKEDLDISTGLRIGAFGNIIYLTTILKEYLFEGKIDNSENQDIYSVIDMYSFNAFHLLTNESIELRIIGHLLRYAYEKVAENSIWNIAEKSPLIRKFIEENLSHGSRYIYSLLPSQREVISDVLTPKKSIVVGMPTSAGKSLLAEMQILFSIHNYQTNDFKPTVCYIVPTNALIDQVKDDLQSDFEAFHFNIETALPYYDVDEIENEILTASHIDILISTPEKLEALVRQNHPAIQNTRLVIMDEAHNLGDASRGSKFELVLSSIKQNMKEANFLLLSPFISNAKEISEWLADSPRNADTISIEWAPTKQYIGCNLLNSKKTESVLQFYKSARNQLGAENIEIGLNLNPQDVKKELELDSIDNTVRLCVVLNDFIYQDGNILILCMGRGTTLKLATQIKEYFKQRDMLRSLSDDPEILKAIEIVKLENGKEDPLIDCLKYGICYHNSGLSALVKETIERLVRNNKIKLIFATTTLAQGMNFPINTVIFDTVNLRGHGELSNAEFWNIAGRAGRAYKDKEGYIILSYAGSQKKTKSTVIRYIESDLKEVVSSLNMFFSVDNRISLDYDVLRESKNAPILNLLQYINHILNISYDYNINPNDIAKIRGILTDSYLYHSLSKQEGFINAQRKLNTFVTQYVRHVNASKREDVTKADELGISDISYTKVKSIIGAFILGLKEKGDNEYKASEIILHTKNVERLSEIINIIAKIPEIKIQILERGSLDSENIAKLLLGWVNGEKVKDIAKSIKRINQSDEEVLSICNRYLNSQMRSYMPWGINIYQAVSFDLQTEPAQMLPSYIYYGVSSKEAVIISKLGVPRFAVGNILNILGRKYPNLSISIENMEKVKVAIKAVEADEYKVENVSGSIIKNIIDSRIK